MCNDSYSAPIQAAPTVMNIVDVFVEGRWQPPNKVEFAEIHSQVLHILLLWDGPGDGSLLPLHSLADSHFLLQKQKI